MVPITLTVNGRALQALVEPRTHLADFLREHCRLTGTHLGCEHGVCGACTVLIAGATARSCLTYAVACDGLSIETIEGFDDDPTMADLREAFSREHGLQCGFCTPGMLISARDIVQRLPNADERRIRVELSAISAGAQAIAASSMRCAVWSRPALRNRSRRKPGRGLGPPARLWLLRRRAMRLPRRLRLLRRRPSPARAGPASTKSS